MKEVTLSVEEVRRAGVTVPVTSRSYTLWIERLTPTLLKRGVSQECIDRGRPGCHVSGVDSGYLLKFHEPEDRAQSTAAERAASEAVVSNQQHPAAMKARKAAAEPEAEDAAETAAVDPPKKTVRVKKAASA